MDNLSKQPSTFIIDAKKSDGSQTAFIKLPLGLLSFGVKVLNLLPGSVKASINQELSAKGIKTSFEDLVSEGHELLVTTVRDVQIDVQGKKQTLKVTVE